MKTFFLLALFSFSALAQDYDCRAGFVKLELKTQDPASLLIRDVQTGEFYYNGVIHEMIERDGLTELMFETRSHTYLQLQFKTSALKNEDAILFGFIRGWHNGGFIDTTIRCSKKTR